MDITAKPWVDSLCFLSLSYLRETEQPALQTVSYCSFGIVITILNLKADDHALSSSVKAVAVRQKLSFPTDTLIEI